MRVREAHTLTGHLSEAIHVMLTKVALVWTLSAPYGDAGSRSGLMSKEHASLPCTNTTIASFPSPNLLVRSVLVSLCVDPFDKFVNEHGPRSVIIIVAHVLGYILVEIEKHTPYVSCNHFHILLQQESLPFVQQLKTSRHRELPHLQCNLDRCKRGRLQTLFKETITWQTVGRLEKQLRQHTCNKMSRVGNERTEGTDAKSRLFREIEAE